MSERLEQLGDDVDVVLVTFTTNELVDDYQRRRKVRFPILLDPDRSTYDAYGLGRGSLARVWGWATLRRYAQILRPSGPGRRADLVATDEDTRQLGGDFVIAPDGTLAWAHRSTGPADRPSTEQIEAAVAAARGGS